MKTWFAILALVAAMPLQALTLGQPRPDLAGSLLGSDQATSLSKLQGDRPLLLAFFSVTCLPCLKEAPDLNRIQEEFGSKLVMLYVSTDPDPLRSKTPGFLARAQSKLPVFNPNAAQAREAYEAYGLPKLVIIDKAGKVHWMHEGYDPSLLQTLRNELAGLQL